MKVSLSLLLLPLVLANYFVQLKDSPGLKRLLDEDDRATVSHHIRPFITKNINIGRFHGMIGNFTDDILSRLKKSPFVAQIAPDSLVKAFVVKDQKVINPRKNSGISHHNSVKNYPEAHEVYEVGNQNLKHKFYINCYCGGKLSITTRPHEAFMSVIYCDTIGNCALNAYENEFRNKCPNGDWSLFSKKLVCDLPANSSPVQAGGAFRIQSIDEDMGTTLNSYDVQKNASRHLARISRTHKLPINQTVNYYLDSSYKGRDVYAYIIDTGINKEHPEFEGRAILGADFTNEGPGDNNNHGTHVAGIVGSKTYGVAKEVTLVEVKALDKFGQGSLTTVISALEFAVDDRKRRGVPGVVNLSLGAVKNPILNQAIKAAVESGLVVVAAAGNSNIDACLTSPASSLHSITVGAIDDRNDEISHFSNWGACVDMFASGVLVESVNAFDFEKPLVHSGTSMASPSVAGLVSILLGKGVPSKEISERIQELSTLGQIKKRSMKFRPLTPDKIAHNGVQRPDDFYLVDDIAIDEGNNFTDEPDNLGKSENESLKSDDENKDEPDPQSVGGLDTVVKVIGDDEDN